MTERACKGCGAPIVDRHRNATYCATSCQQASRKANMTLYVQAWRKRPGNLDYHRDWMARKREDASYRERERERQRLYRLRTERKIRPAPARPKIVVLQQRPITTCSEVRRPRETVSGLKIGVVMPLGPSH